MQLRIFSLLLLLSPLLPAAHALDYAWPGHGTISIEVPNNWSLIAKQTTEVSYAIKGSLHADAPDVLQITLIETPADRPVIASDLLGSLQKIVQPMLDSSVEKKVTPIALHMRQGSGLMTEITDASLVGKTPTANNFKVARSAIIALDEHGVAIVTMLFNDPKSADATEMQNMIQSLRLTRGTKSYQLSQTRSSGGFEFTVPESKLRLSIPGDGFVSDTDRIGGSTDNPRYFKLSRNTQSPPQGLVLSGWFEPSFRFKGDLKKFWAGEADAWKKNGQPAPVNVAFLKSGNWEVIAYDMPFPEGTNCHIRAELTQAGTWIDLHFSLTSQLTAAEAREQLLAELKAVQVSEK